MVEFVSPEDGGHVFLRLLDGVPFIWENSNPQDGFDRELGLAGGWHDFIINE